MYQGELDKVGRSAIGARECRHRNDCEDDKRQNRPNNAAWTLRTAGTEKKLRNLVPFKPGQSGNPKGRPKGARADITDLRLHLDWQDGGGDQG